MATIAGAFSGQARGEHGEERQAGHGEEGRHRAQRLQSAAEMRDGPGEEEVERCATSLVEDRAQHSVERVAADEQRQGLVSCGGQAVRRRARKTATAAVHVATTGTNARSANVSLGAAAALSCATASATTAAYPGSLRAQCRSTSIAARRGTCSSSSSAWTTRRPRHVRCVARARSRRCSIPCRSSSRARASTRPTTARAGESGLGRRREGEVHGRRQEAREEGSEEGRARL